MSCRIGNAFLDGGREAEFSEHSAACPDCAGLSRRMHDLESLLHSLAAPPLPPGLRADLLDIPSRTVSCEGSDALLALALEKEIAPSDEARWTNHLTRCTACSEAAQILFATRGLAAPEPAPWLATLLAASKPASARKARTGLLALLWSPKGAIALAYAAAVVVMLSGFDPADLARKAGMARLEDATGAAVAAARSGAVERIGTLEEKAYRTFVVWKGRLVGYGRATLVNALALVMRTQATDAKRPPDRPKNGGGRSVSETLDGVSMAGKPVPAAPQITGWRA
jgi:predicted anti-sigma-YlaC factor YlaD